MKVLQRCLLNKKKNAQIRIIQPTNRCKAVKSISHLHKMEMMPKVNTIALKNFD